MKAIEILDCIMYMDLSGEDLVKIEVPDEYDEYTPQTEEWWYNELGGCPPEPIASGTYLCLWPNDARDFLQTADKEFVPDATVEVGDSIVYLYYVEE